MHRYCRDKSPAANHGSRRHISTRLAIPPDRGHLNLPPLRDRPADIIPLAHRFLEHISLRDHGVQHYYQLSQEVISRLSAYHFPGNIRELRHAIERAILFCEERTIEPQHLALHDQPSHLNKTHNTDTIQPLEQAQQTTDQENVTAATSAKVSEDIPATAPQQTSPQAEQQTVHSQEAERIRTILVKYHWNRRQAARELGLSYEALRWRIQKYKLSAHSTR